MDQKEDFKLWLSIVSDKSRPFQTWLNIYHQEKIKILEGIIMTLRQNWCDPSKLCCRRCPPPSPIKHSTPIKLKRKNDGDNDEKAWGKRPMYESLTSLEDSSLHLNELCTTPPNFWNVGWVSPDKK